MSVDQKRSRLAFQKLNRQLRKLSQNPAPAHVHKFRTCGRRVEALLGALIPHPNRNDRKLLRLLARLRKKAGRVRDLDVQISALRNLKIPHESKRKSQLLHALMEERSQRERKLAQAFDKETLQQLRRRLKRAASDQIPATTNPLAVALRQLQTLGRDRAPLTERTLHRYRIVGKRARYLAELAGDDPQAQRAIELLKCMQDVLGDWHDWLKLTEKAEALFGTKPGCTLVTTLRNVTHDKFRKSVEVLAETRIILSAPKPAASTVPRKPPAAAGDEATAA